MHPPRLAERVLCLFYRGDAGCTVAGDLDEEFRVMATTRDARTARRWYRRQVLFSVISRIGSRFRMPRGLGQMTGFSFGGSLRYAVRSLRRSPAFAIAAAGTIALTMTLATTVFTIVDGVLFKPLPFERVEELFNVSGGYSTDLLAAHPGGALNRSGLAISALDLRELEAAVPGVKIAGFAGTGSGGAAVAGDLRAWAPVVRRVDRQFLDVLGVQPLLGGFADADFADTADDVIPALVSHAMWRNRLGGRLQIVGTTIDLGPQAARYRISGILGREFLFPTTGVQPDLVIPLINAPETLAGRRRSISAIARLPPHLPLADVQARFDAVARAAREAIPDRELNGGMGPWDVAALRPLEPLLTERPFTDTFRYVFMASILLVVLGCVNVSALLASRLLDRGREIRLRRALGATRGHLVGLVASEAVLVLGLGSLVGLFASRPAVALAVELLPGNMALLREPRLDGRVMAFALIATLVSTALVVLWPLVQLWRERPVAIDTEPSHGVTSSRSVGRLSVVTIQVALGLTLTLAGALVVASLARIWQTDVGYPVDRLFIVQGTMRAGASSRGALDGFLNQIRALPGVTAVGATNASLLRDGMPGGAWRGHTYSVTDGFFDVVPIQVLEGRLPSNEELRSGRLVAAITPAIAAAYFPGQAAIGQSLIESRGAKRAWTIVGVVAEARYTGWVGGAPGHQIYTPLESGQQFSMVLRTSAAAGPILGPVLEAARSHPAVQMQTASSAESLLHETVRAERFRTWLFGAFSASALLIVCVGVLGLMALGARRRTREIGVRLALGARPPAIVRMMVGEQVPAVALGLAIGGTASFWLMEGLRSYLYETTPYDAGVWVAAVIVITAAALVGLLVPAARASRVDPVRVLRAD